MKKRLTLALATVALAVAVVTIPALAAPSKAASLTVNLRKIAAKVKNLTAGGTLAAKFVTYSPKTSGLAAKTVQGALDEVGVGLNELVAGATIGEAQTQGVRAASENSPTTWTATTYGVCTNDLKTATATVTFTPDATDSSKGTWTSTPYNIFNPGGSGAGLCFGSATTNTFSGSFKIVEDMILTHNVTVATGTQPTVGYTATAQIRGNTIVLTDTRNSPQLVSILSRQ